MSTNQLKTGAVLSYLQMVAGVLIGLLYTPIMIQLLGKSEYGLYNTVSSTVSMLSILNLGLGSGYVRYFARYKANGDQLSIYRLNGLFLIIFSIIGFVALACGLFLTSNLELVFDQGLTAEEYILARKLMLLLTISLAVSFPMSVFSNIISANERFVFLKLLGMLKTVGSPLITLPLLMLGFGSVAMVLVSLVLSLVTDAAYLYYVLIRLKNRFVFHGFEAGIFKSLFSYTFFIAINIVIDQINWNVDKVLLGRFRGSASVAVYAVGYTIHTYYLTLSTAISGLMTPRVHLLVNDLQISITEKNKQLNDLFVRVGRIQFLILALACSGFVFFGQDFLFFWVGSGYENSYAVALLLIIPVTIPLIQNVGIDIQRAQNKHQFRSMAYMVMAVINVVMSIELCQRFGETGAAFGTSISLLLANGLVMNIYYHKRCNINIIAFWKSFLRLAIGLLPPVICGIIINYVIGVQSVIGLIVGIIIYTVVYIISMWVLGMNEQEKDLVRSAVRKVVR